MRNGDRAVAYLNVVNTVILADADIIIKLIADKKRFEQGAAKINRHIETAVYFQFFFQLWCNERSAETKLHQVYMRIGNRHEIFSFLYTQPFVHHHRYSSGTGPYIAIWNLRKIKIHEQPCINWPQM